MHALDLDFQPRRFPAAGMALLLAGLLTFVVAMADYRGVADETESWQTELARLQQSSQARRLPRAGNAQEMQQMAQAASTVTRDIQRPWEALFHAVEEAKSDEVALLTLTPDATRGVVQITGEAKGRDSILAFVGRLGQSGVLKNAFLVEDQRLEGESERAYRFLVSADWAGGGK